MGRLISISKYLAISMLGVLLMLQYVHSAPFISSISGTLTHGNLLVINGSSFGTGDTTPIVWDDFEQYDSDSENGDNLKSSPKVGNWLLKTAPVAIYSTAFPHSGSQHSYGENTSEGTGDNLWTNFSVPDEHVTNLPDTYYYVSWWGRFQNDCTVSGQVKGIQWKGTCTDCTDYSPGIFSGSSGAGSFEDAGFSNYIALEDSGSTELVWSRALSIVNTWAHYEMILKQSTVDTADGSVDIKLDGVSKYAKSNVKTRERVGYSWSFFQNFSGMTNGTGCTLRYFAIDDVYINNSWARLEIGDNVTYSSCTHTEIQIPTAWADGSITFTVNRGSFGETDNAYIFVVDSSGNVSDQDGVTEGAQGYPVTFGNSYGGQSLSFGAGAHSIISGGSHSLVIQ